MVTETAANNISAHWTIVMTLRDGTPLHQHPPRKQHFLRPYWVGADEKMPLVTTRCGAFKGIATKDCGQKHRKLPPCKNCLKGDPPGMKA
jgi:hypothetical protein